MGAFDKNKFGSVKQDWATPVEFFKPLDSEFNFTIDAAADNENKKVSRHWDINDNGLVQDWSNQVVWCNPPYGREVALWLKKGAIAAENGCTSVFLVPARTNTAWFVEATKSAKELRFVIGRPKFINHASEDKEAKHGLPVPLALFVFSPPDPVKKCDVSFWDWKNPGK